MRIPRKYYPPQETITGACALFELGQCREEVKLEAVLVEVRAAGVAEVCKMVAADA
jgi:hypothetical protein